MVFRSYIINEIENRKTFKTIKSNNMLWYIVQLNEQIKTMNDIENKKKKKKKMK